MAIIELRDHTINHTPIDLGRGIDDPVLTLPAWGTVSAGALVDIGERQAEAITLPAKQLRFGRMPTEGSVQKDMATLRGTENLFALRVRGDSMVDAGILDGATMIFQRQTLVKNGQIAVVMVEGEATLKQIWIRGAETELRPFNRRLKAAVVPTEQVQVKGVLVGWWAPEAGG